MLASQKDSFKGQKHETFQSKDNLELVGVSWEQETSQTSHPCRKKKKKKWGCQTTPCTKTSKTPPPPPPPPQKKKKEKENRLKRESLNHLIKEQQKDHPDKRTAERSSRHPYNWSVWKTEPKQLATRNPTSCDQGNHPWHHFEGTPKWSSFEGPGSGGDWQVLSSNILDTHLHRWLSWKRHKKRRTWCLHQAPRQTPIICVSIWWDTVLKLLNATETTIFVGREAQESSLSHRHTLSPASPHI